MSRQTMRPYGMQLALLTALGVALGSAATFFLVDRARARRLSLRERLIEARERTMREIAHDLIEASRESPSVVCELLDRAVRELCPAVDTVLFTEREEDALRCIHASGQRAEYFRGAQLLLEHDDSPLTRAALHRHRVASRGLERPLIPGDRAFLAVPMVDGARTVGVFYAASALTDQFDVEESIVTVVDLAVSAYQLARDRQADRQSATTDKLTGLLTPGTFRARLTDAVVQHAAHPDAYLALLFIDTDHFKPVNDTLGHAAGDTVLRTLARIFTHNAGPEALVGRNGGDEFCILFSGAMKTEAVRRAENIRRAVEAYSFVELLEGKSLPRPITTSIGVCAFPGDAQSAESLLEQADAAMYHSKRCGRNRVSFYDVTGSLAEVKI